MQTIMAATHNAADLLGKLEQQGTIEEGKLADILILKEDPLEDITNTKKISLVIKDGKIINRGKLSRDITGRLCEKAKYVADRIDLLPDSAFRDVDGFHKTILREKMEKIYSILKDGDDDTSYFSKLFYFHTALSIVVNVMPYMDGCSDGSTYNDLITNCTYQHTVYALTQQLLTDCLVKVFLS